MAPTLWLDGDALPAHDPVERRTQLREARKYGMIGLLDWPELKDPTLKYCRESFRFALLEARPSPTPDEVIIGREAFWKRVLFSRGLDGLNRN